MHGGVGESMDKLDGCVSAADAGMDRLLKGEEALAGAVAASVVFEDDPRFNCGTGSWPGMDLETIEMDASVMDSRGRLASVACIQRVKNPILVARQLAETPQTLLAGEGAVSFARTVGFPEYYYLVDEARKKSADTMRELLQGNNPDFPREWVNFDIPAYWNFKRRWEDVQKQFCRDTIGVVTQDAGGHFAVCVSTGGSCPMMLGRVGDAALPGVGFFAGTKGAVAVTGIGEYNSRVVLAHTVYRWIESGMPLQQALDLGVADLPEDIDTGIIGVTATEAATSANRPMPTHIIRK